MKIGIMTMQRIDNYGSMFQALALKQILSEMGNKVVFVDFIIEPTIFNRNKNSNNLVKK